MKKQAEGFMKDFKSFAFKGNVLDMAVGVVIGTGFTAIVNSLVKDIITPLIGLFGNTDFTNFFVVLKTNEAYDALSAADQQILAKVQETGAHILTYGTFITAVIQFFLIALTLFIVISAIKKTEKKLEKPQEPAPATTKECPFCKSTIHIDATRCPHCTATLEQ